jgi:hypothetical protein
MFKRFLLAFALGCAMQAHECYAQISNVQLLVKSAYTGPLLQWPGGIGVFSCVGTWGGATVTLEFQAPDNSTMIVAGTYTTLTANGAGVFNLYQGNIQAVVSGATGTTSLSCGAGQVTQALPP